MLPDYDQGTPQYYRMWWRKAFETEAYKSLFGEEDHSEKTFGWSTPITDQTVSCISLGDRPCGMLVRARCLMGLDTEG